MKLYLPDESGTKIAVIEREFHIVPELDCGILIGTDILVPEKMTIDLDKRRLTIGSCGDMTCILRVTPRARISKHPVRAASTVIIEPRSSRIIPIRFKTLKTNQDYTFTPYPNQAYLPNNTYVLWSIIAGNQQSVVVTNVDDVPRTIMKGCCIGLIESLDSACHECESFWKAGCLSNRLLIFSSVVFSFFSSLQRRFYRVRILIHQSRSP